MRAYIGGTFDLFHPGHVKLFSDVKAKFGTVIVSLNTDEFAARYKRKPILSLDERGVLVSSCAYVDEVIVNEGCEDSTVAILKSKPDVIIHGDDWTGPELMKQMGITQAFLDEYQISMFYFPYTQGISTSEIMKRIKDQV